MSTAGKVNGWVPREGVHLNIPKMNWACSNQGVVEAAGAHSCPAAVVASSIVVAAA